MSSSENYVAKNTEAVTQKCSVNKLFLEISQNSQENTCARASFNKVAALSPATSLKKRRWHGCFPVNFAKFLRMSFLTEHIWWLLLKVSKQHKKLVMTQTHAF